MLRKLALFVFLSASAHGQQWIVSGPSGVQQYPASMPYLYDGGVFFAQRATDGVTMYAYRAPLAPGQSASDAAGAAFVVGTPPNVSDYPSLLELDGRFYSLQSPGVIGLSQEWLIGSGSASNCRLPSGPLPDAGQPSPTNALFTIGTTRIKFGPGQSLEIVYHPAADYVRIASVHGNVICNGELPAPVAPWAAFKSGFED